MSERVPGADQQKSIIPFYYMIMIFRNPKISEIIDPLKLPAIKTPGKSKYVNFTIVIIMLILLFSSVSRL